MFITAMALALTLGDPPPRVFYLCEGMQDFTHAMFDMRYAGVTKLEAYKIAREPADEQTQRLAVSIVTRVWSSPYEQSFEDRYDQKVVYGRAIYDNCLDVFN